MYSKDDLRKLAGIKSPASPLGNITESVKKPEPVVEARSNMRDPANSYEGSHEFDGEIAQVEALIKKAKKILLGNKMVQHIKDTTLNYDVDTTEECRAVVKALEDADKALDKFYSKMERAA